MITVITGLTGSGKTWLMSRLALKRRKRGDMIYANMSFNFPNDNDGVFRWHNLSETFTITNGVICIDEGQKLFSARLWPFLPMAFAEKIASQRHEFLDIITTTQDLGHIDLIVRQNIHELYQCRTIFRWPRNERKKPYLQYIKVSKKHRIFDDNLSSIKWAAGREKAHFISKFWTKELYNTYANINLSHFICQIKRDRGKWLIVLQSRQLSNQRQAGR